MPFASMAGSRSGKRRRFRSRASNKTRTSCAHSELFSGLPGLFQAVSARNYEFGRVVVVVLARCRTRHAHSAGDVLLTLAPGSEPGSAGHRPSLSSRTSWCLVRNFASTLLTGLQSEKCGRARQSSLQLKRHTRFEEPADCLAQSKAAKGTFRTRLASTSPCCTAFMRGMPA